MKGRLVWPAPHSRTVGGISGRPRLGWYRRYRTALDRALAAILVLALAPVWPLIALAIKLDSPGPVVYRQRRVGLNGTPFTMYKFRTMFVDCDDSLHRVAFERFFHARSLSETGATTFKLCHDPRITRVGRFLRSTSLDELPQLFNVLNGTMSLVGPRPPIPYETDKYERRHWQRLTVRPGMTGVWQVSARNRVPFEQMFAMDLDYIKRQSLLLDLKILLLTVGAVVNRSGAG